MPVVRTLLVWLPLVRVVLIRLIRRVRRAGLVSGHGQCGGELLMDPSEDVDVLRDVQVSQTRQLGVDGIQTGCGVDRRRRDDA